MITADMARSKTEKSFSFLIMNAMTEMHNAITKASERGLSRAEIEVYRSIRDDLIDALEKNGFKVTFRVKNEINCDRIFIIAEW